MVYYYYAPAPYAGALSDGARLTSVVYIRPKLRTFIYLHQTNGLMQTEMPRKTKICTELAHVTRDLDTTFKVKRSKGQLARAAAYCGGLPHSLLILYVILSTYLTVIRKK